MTLNEPAITVSLDGTLGAFKLCAAFSVPAKGITALFGPSGSGKTTILRCVAGLQRLPGRIAIGESVWQYTDSGIFLEPYRRRVGYVFQEASLFSHLSVRDNLLYGARRSRGTCASGQPDLAGVVDLLDIGHLLERSPVALSGGERQRVAVGRALLSRPDVLLMDEPLSALDRMTKEEILPYFEMLHEKLELPILYISHDLAEIERLADTMVLMDNGHVLACGLLADLQTDPRLPLLDAADASVVLDGRISGIDAAFGLTRFAVQGGDLVAPGRHGEIGDNRRLRIVASDVSLARTAASDSTILNSLPARIAAIEEHAAAPQVNIVVTLGTDGGGSRIVARVTRKSATLLKLVPGDAVVAQIKGVALLSSRTGNLQRLTSKGEPK
jgi:molybdate transport system ATP-binding protein